MLSSMITGAVSCRRMNDHRRYRSRKTAFTLRPGEKQRRPAQSRLHLILEIQCKQGGCDTGEDIAASVELWANTANGK